MASYYVVATGPIDDANSLSTTDGGAGSHDLTDLTSSDTMHLTNNSPTGTYNIEGTGTIGTIAIDATDANARTIQIDSGGTLNLGDVTNGGSTTASKIVGLSGSTTNLTGGTITCNARCEWGGTTNITGTVSVGGTTADYWIDTVDVSGDLTFTKGNQESRDTDWTITAAGSVDGDGESDALKFTNAGSQEIDNSGDWDCACKFDVSCTITGDGSWASSKPWTVNTTGLTWTAEQTSGNQTNTLGFICNSTFTLPSGNFSCNYVRGDWNVATNNTALTVSNSVSATVNIADSTTPMVQAGGSWMVESGSTGTLPATQIALNTNVSFRYSARYRSLEFLLAGLQPRNGAVGVVLTVDDAIEFPTGNRTVKGINGTGTLSIDCGTISITGRPVENIDISATTSASATAASSFENVDCSGGVLMDATGATNVDGNTDGVTGIANGPSPDNENIRFAAASGVAAPEYLPRPVLR